MTTTRVKRFLDSRTLTRALQVVALLSLILATAVAIQQYSLASCLKDYNNASAVSTAARSAAASQDRQADEADRQADAQDRAALREVIDAIAAQDQPRARTAFAALVVTYHQTDLARAATAKQRAENERQRREHPVPEAPSLRCG